MPASRNTSKYSVKFTDRHGGREGWGPRREPCNITGQSEMKMGTGTKSGLSNGILAGTLCGVGAGSRKQSGVRWGGGRSEIWVSCGALHLPGRTVHSRQGQACESSRSIPGLSLWRPGQALLPRVLREGVSTLRFPLRRALEDNCCGKRQFWVAGRGFL